MTANPRIYEDQDCLLTNLKDWLEGDLRQSLLSMNLWREMFDSWRDVLGIVVDRSMSQKLQTRENPWEMWDSQGFSS